MLSFGRLLHFCGCIFYLKDFRSRLSYLRNADSGSFLRIHFNHVVSKECLVLNHPPPPSPRDSHKSYKLIEQN